jgi:hypothetical protein
MQNLTAANVTLDHREPLSRGGSHTLDNLQAVCRGCNWFKGSFQLAEWTAMYDALLRAATWDLFRRHYVPGPRSLKVYETTTERRATILSARAARPPAGAGGRDVSTGRIRTVG